MQGMASSMKPAMFGSSKPQAGSNPAPAPERGKQNKHRKGGTSPKARRAAEGLVAVTTTDSGSGD